MNTHKNARLTAWGRSELIRRLVHDQESVATVAAALHLSRQTVYKWRRRFVAEGWAASNSPQPRAAPPMRGRRRVTWCISTSRGSIASPPSGTGSTGDRRRGGRRQGLGKDFLHVAVDDATRLAYAAVYPTQDAAASTAFLQAARRWYATLGIDVQAVMTDNAKAYLSLPFQQHLADDLIRHLTTRPYRPQTNGKAERFIQTALRRWAFKRPYRTSHHRSAALPTFLDSYNIERPHRALGRIPPLLYFPMGCEQPP